MRYKNFKKSYLILYLFLMVFNMQYLDAQVTENQAEEYIRLADEYLSAGNKTEACSYYNKAGYVFWNTNNLSKAADYFKKVQELNIALGNTNAILTISNNLGLIYSELENYAAATESFKTALKISRQQGDKIAIASALLNVGGSLQGLGKYQESLEYLNEAVDLCTEISNLVMLRKSYGAIAESYENLGNSSKAFEYYEVFASIDKKIKKMEMEDVKHQAETQVNIAQAEKKITEIELGKTDQKLRLTTDTLERTKEITRTQQLELDVKSYQIREQAATIQKRRLISIFFASVAIFVSLILILLYVQFRNKKKANQLLAAQNEEINRQRNRLDMQNKNITSSIQYAMNIQQAILPSKETMDEYFESFIIYRPKDIVSGDFYWFSTFEDKKKKQEYSFLAVVDCTGHGVPGAFMSMIGSRLLNEIVNERNLSEPKEILELLDSETRLALKQDKTDNTDGMDVCLIRLEKKDNNETILTFSGAKRNMYIYKDGMAYIETLKADRRSIGGSRVINDTIAFTNYSISLKKGDQVYLSSDGIIDQHQPNRKRFGSERLLETIFKSVNKPLDNQKENLEKTLDSFKNYGEQRDDITFIGVKIK